VYDTAAARKSSLNSADQLAPDSVSEPLTAVQIHTPKIESRR